MPSTTRRAFVTGSSAVLAALAGCSRVDSASARAHWVTVYLGEREETHDVTVTVADGSGTTLFKRVTPSPTTTSPTSMLPSRG